MHKQEWKITAEGRTCKTCHQWKVWAEFPGRGSKSGKVGNCKDCLNKSFKTRWGVDPEFKRRAQESSRRSHLKRTYGITPEDVDVMIIKQDGKCAICDVRPEDPLCVDHCHTTRQIRGLLCRPCNKALGIFRDSKELLRTAWRYLDETSD